MEEFAQFGCMGTMDNLKEACIFNLRGNRALSGEATPQNCFISLLKRGLF